MYKGALHCGNPFCLAPIMLVALLIASARGQVVAEGAPLPAGNTTDDQAAAKPGSLDNLLDMADKDVSQLSQVKVAGKTGSPSLDMPVSSVSRQDSTVGRSPAAVFVITNEMIRRSGAKEIPEVLRMVPGVDVAKIDSNKWAVSVRGFNGQFANKLLVWIDGRDVYTSLYGRTFWDVQDVLLEDVERIEVIRGPGATVWGANAVNGVINIITKSAKATQGTYVESGAGTYEKGYTSARYGGKISEDLSYRFYGKWFDRGPGFSATGDANDAWNQGRGGMRTDWSASQDDTITFQGDYYNGYSHETDVFGQLASPYYNVSKENVHVSGDNVLMNWKRVFDDQSDWALKLYYDQTQRQWQMLGENRNTFDFDFQDRFPLGDRHDIVWGLGYRNTQSFARSIPTLSLLPAEKSDNLYSCFVQDGITLREDLWFLTVGSKFEHDNYTGFEYQPTARLLWTPDKTHSLWGAISRAVRTPTQGEEGCTILLPPIGFAPQPVFPLVLGNDNLASEELMAYEAGMRSQLTDAFSWDLSVFYNNYARIVSSETTDIIVTPTAIFVETLLNNGVAGDTYGFELASTYRIRETWRLQSAYTFLVMNLHPAAGSASAPASNGQSPRNQFYLQSSTDLGRNWELDLMGRYCDDLPYFGISNYVVCDVRLAWHARKNLEFSVAGRNLFNGHFYEFGNENFVGGRATEVRPEVYGQVIWRR